MRDSEYFPTTKDPLIKAFLDKFRHGFDCDINGFVYYADKDGNWYCTPDTKTEFFDMVSNSLKQGKNLFLNHPDIKLPEGAEE